jgi:hypothetical protein
MCDRSQLFIYRSIDCGIRVPKAEHCGSAGAIQITLAGSIEQITT